MTIICLFNPAHNGDVLFSSKIVDVIVKSNPHLSFKISPSCSSILFEHLVSENVEIIDYPNKWIFDNNEEIKKMDKIQEHLANICNTLWSYYQGDLFINLWQLMLINQNNCSDLSNRVEIVKLLFQEIHKNTGVLLEFHATQYKELIPVIPQFDLSTLIEKINAIVQERNIVYNKRIMFFNLLGKSGTECFCPTYNDDFITNLLHNEKDTLIIVPDHCDIKHPYLISLMDDCDIQKEHNGKSIVIYANFCNTCDTVYFKNNGGSLFQLNQVNLANKHTKYVYLNECDSYYDSFKNVYGLHIFTPMNI
jgi:hypothetical protein